MNISRIKYLKAECDDEALSLEELSEIETAFAEVPDDELTDLRENAMASDMLDVLEQRVTTMERTIYSWVYQNFGESEADDPSWDIGALADELNSLIIETNTGDCKVGDLLDKKSYILDLEDKGDSYAVGNNDKTSDER